MEEGQFQTGSLFWLIFLSLSVVGLIYLGIWSFHNDNIKGLAISSIFSIMIIFSIVISKFEIFKASGGWKNSSLSFSLGFLIWFILGTIAKNNDFSLLSMEKSSMFAAISSQLPLFWQFVIDNIVIPIAEESLWLIGLPFMLIWIMNIIGKKWSLFENKIIQLFVIVMISGLTFAFFHVGKLFIAFIAAAFIFRSVMIIFLYGDSWFNLVPSLVIVPSFMLGAHIANNWSSIGLWYGTKILMTNPFGWFLLILLVVLFISAIDFLLEKIFGIGVSKSV